jgi:outer membrane protein TolC
MKKILIPTLAIIACSFVGNSQTIKQIQLKEVLKSVQENNTNIKIANQNVYSAKADMLQANGIFLPTIKASHTAMATTNPLNAFGSKLNQEILTAADFNPSLLNSPEQIENFATKIEILQPLVNIDGIFQRKAAQTKLKATELQAERSAHYLSLKATNTYMQLQLAYEQLSVLKIAQKTVLENQRITKQYFEQGYLQKTDVLAIQIRVTEVKNQITQAHNNIQKTSNYLSLLMNNTSYKTYKPDTKLTVQNPKISFSFNPNRNDVLAMNEVLNAYRLQYKSDKMSFLPRLNAFGSYELHDDTLFKGSANGYTFGAQLSWTLFEGNKRIGKLKKSKSAFEKAKLENHNFTEQEKITLKNASLDFKESQNNLKVAELSMEQAEEIFRIKQNRYKEGLEKTSDLLQSETFYTQKKLTLSSAIFSHNYALAYLDFLTK